MPLHTSHENDRNLTNSSPCQSFACSRSVGCPGVDDHACGAGGGRPSQTEKTRPYPLVTRHTHPNPSAQSNLNPGCLGRPSRRPAALPPPPSPLPHPGWSWMRTSRSGCSLAPKPKTLQQPHRCHPPAADQRAAFQGFATVLLPLLNPRKNTRPLRPNATAWPRSRRRANALSKINN